MWSILTVGLFNSIMFPTIFTLGVAELGPLTGSRSGILNMAIAQPRLLEMDVEPATWQCDCYQLTRYGLLNER